MSGHLTDLETVRLCAEAMEYPFRERTSGQFKLPVERRNKFLQIYCQSHGDWYRYDPLHDDAQAMALVKKFLLDARFNDKREIPEWIVTPAYKPEPAAFNPDLNRAICECVAKMQQAKTCPAT